MKFNDACDKVFDLENDRLEKAGKGKLAIQPSTMKILCFIWNIVAIALDKDKTMDDLVYLDDRNNIVSVPFTKKAVKKKVAKKTTPFTKKAVKKKVAKKTTAKKSASKKTAKKGALDGAKKQTS